MQIESVLQTEPAKNRFSVPLAPNTRARTMSQSTLHAMPNEPGDMGLSGRLSHADNNSSVTQLLTSIRADMTTNHMSIHEGLMTLNSKIDNIVETCKDLQSENIKT